MKSFILFIAVFSPFSARGEDIQLQNDLLRVKAIVQSQFKKDYQVVTELNTYPKCGRHGLPYLAQVQVLRYRYAGTQKGQAIFNPRWETIKTYGIMPDDLRSRNPAPLLFDMDQCID